MRFCGDTMSNKDINDIFDGELTGKRYSNFIWPSILMMVVMALYYTIDSIFVANLVGEDGLATINIAYPVQGLLWGLAVMLASGSSALVGIDMGLGKRKEADEKFTFVCVFATLLGLVMTVCCLIFMDPVVEVLGATELLKQDCDIFLGAFIWGCPFIFLGVLLEFFIRVDGRPAFTILLYIAGGVVHLGLDILLMGPMHMGLLGAALANVAGLASTALMGLFYFIFRDTRLRFRKFIPDFKYIWHSFVNGSPEFINESSAGIMVFCYNMILVRLAGETGVAAGAVVLQIHYLFMSIHMGYQVGSMPLISYFFGAKRFDKINKVMLYTRKYMIATSLLMTAIFLAGAPYIAMVYARPGTELYDMSVVGLRIISLSILVIGINVFASGFFTCFGNGIISCTISLSRGLIMLLVGLFVLSYFFGINGTWMALPFADITTLALSFGLLARYRGKYNYKILGE